MPDFRVHLTSGEKIVFTAANATAASNAAKDMRPGEGVLKVKLVRETAE